MFDVFVSYSRDDDHDGQIGEFVEYLKKVARQCAGDSYEIFFDRSEIKNAQDWRIRIREGLREAPILLTMVSPSFFDSDYCEWEWRLHANREVRMRALFGGGKNHDMHWVPILLTDLPNEPSQANPWAAEVTSAHTQVDLKYWFASGDQALAQAPFRHRIEGLDETIKQQVERAELQTRPLGNLIRPNEAFVGRLPEFEKLDESVREGGNACRVTVVHGIGGIGKTELARQYAYACRDQYQAGVWQLSAEGQKELLPLLATLANDLEFKKHGFVVSEAAQQDPNAAGEEVAWELVRRCEELDAGTMVILDNVDQPLLISDAQVDRLPNELGLFLVVSTQRGKNDFNTTSNASFVAVPALNSEETIELLQLRALDSCNREGERDRRFDTDEAQCALKKIAELIGGFTLIAEHISVLLSLQKHASAEYYLEKLKRGGLEEAVVSRKDDIAALTRHREMLLSVVLADSLSALNEDGQIFEASALKKDGLQLEDLNPYQIVFLAATQLPPDNIPWQWLEAALFEVAPNTPREIDGEDTMLLIRDRLVGRQLLNEVSDEICSMHRMVSETCAPWTPSDLSVAVRQEWWKLAKQLLVEEIPIDGWQPSALIDALTHTCNQASVRGELALSDVEAISYFLPQLSRYVADARCADLALSLVKAVPVSSRIGARLRTISGDLLRNRRPNAALRYYEQALKTLQSLTQSIPNDRAAERDLAVCLNNTAEFKQRYDPDTAFMYHQQALEIRYRLQENTPNNRQAQRDLAESLSNVACILQSYDPDTAFKYHQQALEIRYRLEENTPNNRQVQRELNASHIKIADIIQHYDPKAADSHCQKALSISRCQANDAPNDRQAQRDLAVCLGMVGDVLRARNPTAALGHYQEALRISRDLADNATGDRRAQRDLAVYLAKEADILRSTSREKALIGYQQSLKIRRSLAETAPRDRRAQRDLTVALTQVAQILGDSDSEKALDQQREVLKIHRSLADAASEDRVAQRDLAISLENVANMIERIDLRTALTHHQEALEIRRYLADTAPMDRRALRELCVSVRKVATILEHTDPESALSYYQEVLRIDRGLAEADPDNRIAQRDLAISLGYVAQLLYDKDPAVGLDHYHESLSIYRKLAETSPQDHCAQEDLAKLLAKLAMATGNRSHWEESLGILRALHSLPTYRDRVHDLLHSALVLDAQLLGETDPASAAKLQTEAEDL